jgi:hypothetical protein
MKTILLRDLSAQAAAGTVTGDKIVVQQDAQPFSSVSFVLNVTAAATDVADTLDVYVDVSPDNGATWLNAVHFTQVLGNGGVKKFVAVLNTGDLLNDPDASLDVSADAAVGVSRNIGCFDCVRYRGVMVDADADGSFTYSVIANYR